MRLWFAMVRFGVAMCLVAPPVHAADEVPDVRPGLWRMAIAIEIPNASGPDTGPMQYERCIVPENMRNMLIRTERGSCSVLESKLTKRSMVWTVRCSQMGMASTARGKIDFATTRLSGTIVTISEAQPEMKITTRLSARHIGQCVSTAPAAVTTPSAPAASSPQLPAYR